MRSIQRRQENHNETTVLNLKKKKPIRFTANSSFVVMNWRNGIARLIRRNGNHTRARTFPIRFVSVFCFFCFLSSKHSIESSSQINDQNKKKNEMRRLTGRNEEKKGKHGHQVSLLLFTVAFFFRFFWFFLVVFSCFFFVLKETDSLGTSSYKRTIIDHQTHTRTHTHTRPQNSVKKKKTR